MVTRNETVEVSATSSDTPTFNTSLLCDAGDLLNGSLNNMTECYDYENTDSPEGKGVDLALGALLVLSNTLIVVVVARRWVCWGAPLGAKVGPCMLVLHLAFSDLLVGALTVFHVLALDMPALQEGLVASRATCVLALLLPQAVGNASAATLVAIAVDRWLAVEYALRYRNCVKMSRALVIVALIWLVSALFAAPLAFLSTWEPGAQCEASNTFQEAALWATLALELGALLACYVRIHVVTVRTLRRGSVAVARTGTGTRGPRPPSPVGPLGSKAARVLLLILAWDAIAYAPYFIITILGLGGIEVEEWISYLCTSFMKLTFVADPFIYAAHNPFTKKAMLDFFKCACRRHPPRLFHRDSLAVIEARKRPRSYTSSFVISKSIERIPIEGT